MVTNHCNHNQNIHELFNKPSVKYGTNLILDSKQQVISFGKVLFLNWNRSHCRITEMPINLADIGIRFFFSLFFPESYFSLLVFLMQLHLNPWTGSPLPPYPIISASIMSYLCPTPSQQHSCLFVLLSLGLTRLRVSPCSSSLLHVM